MNSISRIIRQLAYAPLILIASCAPAKPAAVPITIAELAGRTAGSPQRCVPAQQTSGLRIADKGVVIYGSGRTVWLNRLASDCPGMTRMDILVVEPTGSQYCRGDRVRTVDPVSRIPGPACILGDFVPYTR
jgi:hypothetical protein